MKSAFWVCTFAVFQVLAAGITIGINVLQDIDLGRSPDLPGHCLLAVSQQFLGYPSILVTGCMGQRPLRLPILTLVYKK